MARILWDRSVVWPEVVAADVEFMAVNLFEDAAWLKRVSKKRYRWDFNSETEWFNDYGDTPSRIRLALNLPSAGEGC